MKQKVTNSTPVTKEEVTDIVKKELSNYPTKNDLSERLTESQEAFRRELDYKFQILDEHWERRFNSFESRILTAIDPLLQELKIRHQEREIVAGQISRVEGDVDKLKKRVTKLEHS